MGRFEQLGLHEERQRIDEELTALTEEQSVIEELLERLQGRLDAAEARFSELLAQRDRLDELQWSEQAVEPPALRRAPLVPARPNRLVATTELVREPWGIDDEANVVPLLVDPSQTLRLQLHMRRPAGRRIGRRQGPVAVPTWTNAAPTIPIWRREAVAKG